MMTAKPKYAVRWTKIDYQPEAGCLECSWGANGDGAGKAGKAHAEQEVHKVDVVRRSVMQYDPKTYGHK